MCQAANNFQFHIPNKVSGIPKRSMQAWDANFPAVAQSGSGISIRNSKYFSKFEPPEISLSIRHRLNIDNNIEKRLAGEQHIRYALNSVFNIISDSLDCLDFSYRIDATLRDKDNLNGWERIEIIIKFPDEHYDDISGYWKCISTSVSDFYTSLKHISGFSDDIIIRIRKFIYILVRSEE